MSIISKSIPKVDHNEKISGSAMYVCDYPTDGMLHGRVLRSDIPRGIVRSLSLPELPAGYYYIDKNDVPGVNSVHIVGDDTPVFTDNVEYIGDPIGMLIGPCEREIAALLDKVTIEYEELKPVFDVSESDTVFFDYNIDKGNSETAFIEADRTFEFKYETGLQEHMYLETNGIIGEYKDGKVYLHGSIQCPYYVHSAVVQALGFKHEDVIIRQDVTGGGFGGKEDYPSALACQVAVATLKAGGKPVRVVFGRAEDIVSTPKRHPSYSSYKVAVKNGKVTAMNIDILLDAGAYTTLSMVVLQRSTIGACGVYDIPNIKIHGHARKTNTVPSGAFRGFGGPQAFFGVEMCMCHVAAELGIDPVVFKKMHYVKQGDLTSTSGRYHFPVPLPVMTDDVLLKCDYHAKRKLYSHQTGRYRKGIGFSAVYHGAGFTGNGERDKIKAVARLHKHSDGTVEVLTAGTDMGQGLFTTFTKIVSAALNIAPERVIVGLPDTSLSPDSGPTVASRSIMVVGQLLRRAAVRLKEEWVDGKEQVIEQHYEHPDFMISFDDISFKGDAYPTYSWAVNAVEVEIDILTGCISIIGAWGCFDIGTVIDEQIAAGQMEGGFIQSLGYGMMEKITARKGRLDNIRFSDYIIPTSKDFPVIKVMFYAQEYPEGPFGAKGAGELPHVGGAPAVIDAIQNALGTKLNKAPFLPEDVMDILRVKNRR